MNTNNTTAATVPAFLQRMREEASQLADRSEKLGHFIASNPAFRSLSPADQALMRRQYKVMAHYHAILRQRIESAEITSSSIPIAQVTAEAGAVTDVVRSIETHKATPADTCTITVNAIGERGPGGGNNVYIISGFDPYKRPDLVKEGQAHDAAILELMREKDEGINTYTIGFQNGNPAQGWNGVTIETLLAVCADRLEGFQAGPYACAENAGALTSIKAALDSLHSRSRRVQPVAESKAG